MDSQEIQKPELFTELNSEEAASVNGGYHCYYGRSYRRYRRSHYYGGYYRRHRVYYRTYYYSPRYYYSRASYGYGCDW